MSILEKYATQDVTIWRVTGPDGFGGDKVSAPEVIKGRWVERQETYIGQIDRREHISNSQFYPLEDVALGDYVALGDLSANSDPSLVPGAFKIQRYEKRSDLRTLEYVRKCYL